MKFLKKLAGHASVAGLVCAAFLLAGCQAPAPVYEDIEGLPTGPRVDLFQVGDMVGLIFSPPRLQLQTHQEAIKDDGTITPPFVGPVVAAGKSPGQLQKELQEEYNKKYNNLTVTVQPVNRWFHVLGEVKKPGPAAYLGETDIVKAIAAAGDFTEWANKKRVKITRADGRVEVVNVLDIIRGERYRNVPVYPGDSIFVRRRWL